jgi:hypothetical protein
MRRSQLEASGQKCRTLSEKQIKSMTQVVEQLSSKLEALSSIPRAAKKKRNGRNEH